MGNAIQNEAKEGSKARQRDGILRERGVFGVVVFVGLAALFFGWLQLKNTIQGPFRFTSETQQELGETGSTIASLSQKDTDNDGLTDYDELYIYQTSP